MPDYTSPDDEEFFAAMGRFTIAWAYLETGIDALVVLCHFKLAGSEFEPEAPRALERKLRFLRKAARELPYVAQRFPQTTDLLDATTAEVEFRHDLIHGYVVEHDLSKSIEIKLVRLLRGQYPIPQKKITVTTLSVLEAATRVNKLANRVLTLAHEMAAPFLSK